MNKLTIDVLKSIWTSIDSFGQDTGYTLFLTSDGKNATLHYSDSRICKEIANGSISIVEVENDVYVLSIGDKFFYIRLYIPDDKMPILDLNIPKIGYVTFMRKRN